MSSNFSRTLSLLRHERGISQRSAASDLNVSQALLSHYENGIREPGLEFVVRACEYYEVSADYLLGRTMARDGSTIFNEEIPEYGDEKDNILRKSVLATLNKKLLINTISIIFDILGKSGNRTMIIQASSFLGTSLYKIFRHLYNVYGKNPQKFFSTPFHVTAQAVSIDLALSEMKFADALGTFPFNKEKTETNESFELSNDMLMEEYPLLYKSLLQILHITDERIKKIVDSNIS